MRVPHPMICLNFVIDSICLSRTIIPHVFASTPVVINFDVITIWIHLVPKDLTSSASACRGCENIRKK